MKKRQKIIAKFVLIQVALVLIFGWILYDVRPINLDETKSLELIVENKEYKRVFNEYRLSIYSDSKEYIFASISRYSGYTKKELYEEINVGDKLSIMTVERHSITGNRLYIVDARTEKNSYLLFDEYNKSKEIAFIIVLCLSLLIQVLYTIIIVVYVRLKSKNFLL